MPAERYFIDQDLQTGSVLSLKDREHHHLARVMRTEVGQHIEVVNGRGQLAHAEVTRIGKQDAELRVMEVLEVDPDPYQLILLQAIPRSNRLDGILEKGTELGMTSIWLFPADRSEKKKFNDSQKERMRQICISALKQCGRFYLPEIKVLPPIRDWTPFQLPLFFGDIEPEAPVFQDAWAPHSDSKGCLFAVGPESGFTPKEDQALRDLGGNGVKLHENILRTDTAPLIALGLIKHWLLRETASEPI